ncbi:VWA domain-containing protein [Thermodesulfobacteriota bacterium]
MMVRREIGRIICITLMLIVFAALGACDSSTEPPEEPWMEEEFLEEATREEEFPDPPAEASSDHADEAPLVPSQEEWTEGKMDLPAEGDPGPIDILLVLDNSGSMKENDPLRLMTKVVQTFSSELAFDTRFGIVVFDNSARVALQLTEVGRLGFPTQVKDSLRQLDYKGQRTDIAAGVERALYELKHDVRPGTQKMIVLLTDGIVDVGNAEQDLVRAQWLAKELKQQAKQDDVRIFGIAFEEAADYQLIQTLSVGTGGQYRRVLSASQIEQTFEEIRESIEEVNTDTPLPPPSPPSPTKGWRFEIIAVIGLLVLGVVAIVALNLTSRKRRKGERMPVAFLHDFQGITNRTTHKLKEPITRIGRVSKDNDIVIPRETLSAYHAMVEFRNGVFYLKDLQSTNGTSKNGKIFSNLDDIREVRLKHGDRIKFDQFEFEFSIAAVEKELPTRVPGEGAFDGTLMRGTPEAQILPDVQPADDAIPLAPAWDEVALPESVSKEFVPEESAPEELAPEQPPSSASDFAEEDEFEREEAKPKGPPPIPDQPLDERAEEVSKSGESAFLESEPEGTISPGSEPREEPEYETREFDTGIHSSVEPGVEEVSEKGPPPVPDIHPEDSDQVKEEGDTRKLEALGHAGPIRKKPEPDLSPPFGQDIEKELAVESKDSDNEFPYSFIINEYCKHHRDQKVMEICPRCKKGWCELCIKEVDGEMICVDCAEKGS